MVASGINGCHSGSYALLASDFLRRLDAAGTYWVLYLLGVMIILLTASLAPGCSPANRSTPPGN